MTKCFCITVIHVYNLSYCFNEVIFFEKQYSMIKKITYNRASGILAHITSLPSPYGIGDLGPSTYNFIRFLANTSQTFWQILPLGPTDQVFDNSPYMTVSAFAGNPLLISPELLQKNGAYFMPGPK
jgi:4-alpha-glucanotransferase